MSKARKYVIIMKCSILLRSQLLQYLDKDLYAILEQIALLICLSTRNLIERVFSSIYIIAQDSDCQSGYSNSLCTLVLIMIN